MKYFILLILLYIFCSTEVKPAVVPYYSQPLSSESNTQENLSAVKSKISPQMINTNTPTPVQNNVLNTKIPSPMINANVPNQQQQRQPLNSQIFNNNFFPNVQLPTFPMNSNQDSLLPSKKFDKGTTSLNNSQTAKIDEVQKNFNKSQHILGKNQESEENKIENDHVDDGKEKLNLIQPHLLSSPSLEGNNTKQVIIDEVTKDSEIERKRNDSAQSELNILKTVEESELLDKLLQIENKNSSSNKHKEMEPSEALASDDFDNQNQNNNKQITETNLEPNSIFLIQENTTVNQESSNDSSMNLVNLANETDLIQSVEQQEEVKYPIAEYTIKNDSKVDSLLKIDNENSLEKSADEKELLDKVIDDFVKNVPQSLISDYHGKHESAVAVDDAIQYGLNYTAETETMENDISTALPVGKLDNLTDSKGKQLFNLTANDNSNGSKNAEEIGGRNFEEATDQTDIDLIRKNKTENVYKSGEVSDLPNVDKEIPIENEKVFEIENKTTSVETTLQSTARPPEEIEKEKSSVTTKTMTVEDQSKDNLAFHKNTDFHKGVEEDAGTDKSVDYYLSDNGFSYNKELEEYEEDGDSTSYYSIHKQFENNSKPPSTHGEQHQKNEDSFSSIRQDDDYDDKTNTWQVSKAFLTTHKALTPEAVLPKPDLSLNWLSEMKLFQEEEEEDQDLPTFPKQETKLKDRHFFNSNTSRSMYISYLYALFILFFACLFVVMCLGGCSSLRRLYSVVIFKGRGTRPPWNKTGYSLLPQSSNKHA